MGFLNDTLLGSEVDVNRTGLCFRVSGLGRVCQKVMRAQAAVQIRSKECADAAHAAGAARHTAGAAGIRSHASITFIRPPGLLWGRTPALVRCLSFGYGSMALNSPDCWSVMTCEITPPMTLAAAPRLLITMGDVAGVGPEIIARVVDKFVGELAERLAAQKVKLEVSEAARKWLAEKGYDPRFGARPLGRLIEAELARALRLNSKLIGINNRDLKTFATTLATSERLARLVPRDRIVIGESGIFTPDDLARLAGAGIFAFLIGESLMRQNDVAAATRSLLARRPALAR